MNYATVTDLVDRFGEKEMIRITQPDDFDATAVDEHRAERAIADASAQVDGYLEGRNEVPLAPVPRVIVTITCDLARYHLYDDQATEQIRDRYKDAVRFLEAVSSGKVSLGVSESGESAKGAGDIATIHSDGRTFGRDGDGKGFI